MLPEGELLAEEKAEEASSLQDSKEELAEPAELTELAGELTELADDTEEVPVIGDTDIE